MLVVDDSAVLRRLISAVLAQDPAIEVVGAARDGLHAIELVDELLPVRERYAQMERADVLSLQRVLERAGAQRKQALAAPAAQLAHGLHAMVRGLVDGWLLHRNFDLQATTRAAVLAYLRGIGLPPRSQALGNR